MINEAYCAFPSKNNPPISQTLIFFLKKKTNPGSRWGSNGIVKNTEEFFKFLI